LDCTKPALMSERVNQPTAYSPVFEFMFSVVLFLSRLLAHGGPHVDYKGSHRSDPGQWYAGRVVRGGENLCVRNLC
jgi:hypothetical protein